MPKPKRQLKRTKAKLDRNSALFVGLVILFIILLIVANKTSTLNPINYFMGKAGNPTPNVSDVTWNVTYFRNAHKTQPTLKNVTADKVTGVNTQVKGISVQGQPFRDMDRYNFSIRWEANVEFEPGQYVLSGKANDGVRIWVGGQKVVDNWADRANTIDYITQPINLSGTKLVEVEYYQMYEDSYLTFNWAKVGSTPTPSNPTTPTPTVTPPPSNTQPPVVNPIATFDNVDWNVKYFRNANKNFSSLKGVTADLVRDVPGTVRGIKVRGQPFNSMNRYNFSIRWEANVAFDGTYTITGVANDGIRIWVDGKQIVNDWRDRASNVNYASSPFTLTGNKLIEVEYYQMYEDAFLDITLNKSGGTTPTPTPSTPSPTPSNPPTPTPSNPPPVTGCETGETYGTINYISSNNDRLPDQHADMNLGLRGFVKIQNDGGLKQFADYNGDTDIGAPNFYSLFSPAKTPSTVSFTSVYRVRSWNWGTPPNPGTPGGEIGYPPVTALGIKTDTGEVIRTPKSKYDMGNNFKAVVLYADTNRITLNYTTNDTVANGYTIHIENICVDKNLLSLYRQLSGTNIKRTKLPGLKLNQPIGKAMSTEIQVVIRDRGSFMDPRSRKDWWQEQSVATPPPIPSPIPTPSTTPTPAPEPTPIPSISPIPVPSSPSGQSPESLWNIKYYNFVPCNTFLLDDGSLNPSEDPSRYYRARNVYSCTNSKTWQNSSPGFTTKEARNDLGNMYPLSPNAQMSFFWTKDTSQMVAPSPNIGTQFWTAQFDRRVRLNGNYILSYGKDDGIKVYIKSINETNYKRILSDWNTFPAGLDSSSGRWTLRTLKSVPVSFPNDIYDIHIEYYQNGYLSAVVFDYTPTTAKGVNYNDIIQCERGVNCGPNGEKDLWESYQWIDNAVSKGRPNSKLNADSYISDNGLSFISRVMNFFKSIF